jgi:hypothetical protein
MQTLQLISITFVATVSAVVSMSMSSAVSYHKARVDRKVNCASFHFALINCLRIDRQVADAHQDDRFQDGTRSDGRNLRR